MSRCARLLFLLTLVSLTSGTAFAELPRGVVEAAQRTVLSSELSGLVASLPKREGDSFSKGETLAQIGCALYEAERQKVAIRLRQAERVLGNKQRLSNLDAVGTLEVNLADLAVQEKAAELEIARLNTDRCLVKAPFDGRVVKQHISEYQSVQPQQKLLEVVGQQLEARIIIPATWLTWLENDEKVVFSVEETGTMVEGQVVRIGAAVDPVSHTLPVWTRLSSDNGDLRPGMSGTARFPGRPGEESQ